MEEYFILILKLMYGNVDASILWLRLIAKYLMNKFNFKMSKYDSCNFFKKNDVVSWNL